MKRKIGSLGLSPVKAFGISHNGRPGSKGGPEYYLDDKINLNIVYSVYENPKTMEEIAEDLGMTPVFLEDRIAMLLANGFLVETKGKRYTTYVRFSPKQYSNEAFDNVVKMQLKVAKLLLEKYVPQVREAVSQIKDVYIPGGNRELFVAAAIFYAIEHKCMLQIDKDVSKYRIRTLDGGDYSVTVEIKSEISDPEYIRDPAISAKEYWACGTMTRSSAKYPCVYSWSVDSRFDNRKGAWQNNWNSDYESVYEIITKAITDTKANADKFKRLRERGFIEKDGTINIMILKQTYDSFDKMIPSPEKVVVNEFARYALEQAMVKAKQYPPQVQYIVIVDFMHMFIGFPVAMMVLDELYDSGTFRPLSKQEKVTVNLLMFADRLPE